MASQPTADQRTASSTVQMNQGKHHQPDADIPTAEQPSKHQPVGQPSTSSQARPTPMAGTLPEWPSSVKIAATQQAPEPKQPDSASPRMTEKSAKQPGSASDKQPENAEGQIQPGQGITAGDIMTPQTKQLAAAYVPRRQQQEPSYLDRKVRGLQASISRQPDHSDLCVEARQWDSLQISPCALIYLLMQC